MLGPDLARRSHGFICLVADSMYEKLRGFSLNNLFIEGVVKG